jgi:hypothetical protein
MRRLFAKYSDWFLLVILSALAFWMLGRPLFTRGQLYHDNVRLYSVFRDALNAANHHGELMLWNPDTSGLGFPVFYFTHLGTNTLAPLSVLWLGLAWLGGLVGIRVDPMRFYLLHIYLVVPLALTVSFLALARQLVRHPLARAYLLVAAAFSPGVLFNYSDNGPEQTAYGFFAAAAFLRFYRRPDVSSFLLMGLALGACAAALNHIALYWNAIFLPAFVGVVILVGPGVRERIDRAWKVVPRWAWIGLALLLVSYVAWPARTFSLGRDLVRSTLGTRVYEVQDLLAGNPIEPLTSGTPGVGFEWIERPSAARPEYAIVTYPGGVNFPGAFAYTYLGALTLPLCVLGLIFDRSVWRMRLFLLTAGACLIAPLAGASGLFSILVEAVYPLRAVNHYSDTLFRNGTNFLLLLGAGLGIDAVVVRRRSRRARALFIVFAISAAASTVALFSLYPGHFDTALVSFFGVMTAFHLTALAWLASGVRLRAALGAVVFLTLIDVSTVAGLHARYVVWPLAMGPWPALTADHFSIPTWDSRRQYADELLTLGEPSESHGPAPASLPEFGLFADVEARDPEPAPGASIQSKRQTYNTRIFETQTDREVYLVWRNRFFKGWTASIRPLGEGGETAAAPVVRAFGELMAARIPPGRSEVTFRFAPPGFFPLFLWVYASLSCVAVFMAWVALRTRQMGDRVQIG